MLLRIALLLIACSLAQAQLAISGAASVKQGATSTYTASGGTPPYTYSMIGGSAGSVNASTGVYTAPATITPKSAPNGCQVLPNNHIFNTVMSAVPTDTRTNGGGTNNSVWMASYQAVFGGMPPNVRYQIDFPLNYVQSSDPTTSLTFFYGAPTANYNIPAFPNMQSESGYALYNYNVSQTDHHSLMLATDLCQMQEIYQYYPIGFQVMCPNGVTPSPPTPCRSQSGQKYALTNLSMSAFGTDAAGLELYPLLLKISELKAGAINHMLRVTMCAGCLDFNSHQWPAQSDSGGTPNHTLMPYGAILRLKAGYTWPGYDGSCTTSLCHTYVQTLLTQMKAYGLVVADIGTTAAVQALIDSPVTPDIQVGADNSGALPEIAAILGLNSTNFDFINVTSLQTAQGGSGTNSQWGEVKYNNGTVTPQDYAIVNVTDNVSATAQISVGLQGISIGVQRPTEVFEAGTAATQMAAWVSGASNTAYTCSLSPSGGDNGTVTSGCLYSPATTVAGKTKTVLTFTATADGTTTATQDIVIFPAGNAVTVRFNEGDIADYTDGGGNLWYADLKTGDPPLWQASYSYNFGAQAWTNAGQSPRIYDRVGGLGSDIYHFMHLPNGTYTLTLNFADNETAINQRNGSIDSQGIVNVARFDYFTESGAQLAAFAKQYTVTVTDGTLQFVVRNLGVAPTFTNPCCTGNLYNQGFAAYLSGFSLTQTGTSIPGSKITGQFTGSGRFTLH